MVDSHVSNSTDYFIFRNDLVRTQQGITIDDAYYCSSHSFFSPFSEVIEVTFNYLFIESPCIKALPYTYLYYYTLMHFTC